MLCKWLPLLQPRVLATLALFAVLLLPPGASVSARAQTITPPPTRIAPTGINAARSPSDLKPAKRQPAPALGSLPPLKASGPRRILLVDDDWSENNAQAINRRLSVSDQTYRQLVEQAVGGDVKAWEVEVVPTYKAGPAFERLHAFNVIIWYTAGSYGGNPDNSAVLSPTDEATVRRYLQETGGAFILISPGYLSNLGYGATWEKSTYPFVKDVMGLNGFAGLVQRGAGSEVQSPDGKRFIVERPGPGGAETQFSAGNSDGAAIVFTAKLDARRTAEGPVPVALAHPYGGGRFVYVGFTLENVAAPERTAAFNHVLQAATGSTPPPPTLSRTPSPVDGDVVTVTKLTPPVVKPGPAPKNLSIQRNSPAVHPLTWDFVELNSGDRFEVYRRSSAGWILLADGLRTTRYDDVALLPSPTAYKVILALADGSRGEAVLEYPDPPQPTPATGLRYTQTGPGKLVIEWSMRNTAPENIVYGPGIPTEGRRVQTGTTTLTDLPVGVYDIHIQQAWGNLLAPGYASMKVVVNPYSGRYRLLFTGVEVKQQADDDILGFDGRGNEIYVGGAWITTDRRELEPASAGGVSRSRVIGDTMNFPDRVAGGTASPHGGLKTGDVVPANARTPQPGVTATNDRFPLVIWEGDLVKQFWEGSQLKHGPLVGVIPIVFEWNAVDHESWGAWANQWRSGVTRNTPGINFLRGVADTMRRFQFAALTDHPLHGFTSVQDSDNNIPDELETIPLLLDLPVRAGFDRPMGMIQSGVPRPFVVPTYAPSNRGFVFTYDAVEAALGRERAIILTLPWRDSVSGHYVGYFQLERLSPTPPLPPPPPTPQLTTSIIAPVQMAVLDPSAQPPAPLITEPTRPPAQFPTNENVATIKPVPVGPAPTGIKFLSRSPVLHTLQWNGNGAPRFTVLRRQGENWITVASQLTQPSTEDFTFVPPGTVYRIVGHHADGREGRAEFTATNPQQPAVYSNLQATQTGHGEVTFTFTSSEPEGLHIPTLIGPGVQPSAGTLRMTGVPEGTHAFRLVPAYSQLGGSPSIVEAPGETSTTVTVHPWRALEHRVILLGFRVGRKTTDDDILDFDGRGDEVFSERCHCGRESGSQVLCSPR